jgi:legumain
MIAVRLFVALIVLPAAVHAEIHAVVVAASATWENYRHQADGAHAYKILTEGGVKPENIVTFMVDDIANNPLNPYPGKIFNTPAATMAEAKDVYAAVKDHIDYKGKDVSPQNFLAILQGLPPVNCTDSCTKRTLKSTEEDHLFVYFVDHGGQGVWGFPPLPPDIFFQLLDGVVLIDTLKAAYAKKMWKKFTFYVEACEGSSVFEGWGRYNTGNGPALPTNMSLYTMSAANATSVAWGTFCENNSNVGGKMLGTCLADRFSLAWMSDTEVSPPTTETLQQQFVKVKAATAASPSNPKVGSTVTLDGDQSFTSDPISAFLGAKPSKAWKPTATATHTHSTPLVSSRDMRLSMLEWRLAETKRGSKSFGSLDEVEQAVSRERAIRGHADQIFASVWAHFRDGATLDLTVMSHHPPMDYVCLRAAINAVEGSLGGFNGYSLQYVRVLSELCETEVPTVNIVDAVMRFATPQPFMADAAKE